MKIDSGGLRFNKHFEDKRMWESVNHKTIKDKAKYINMHIPDDVKSIIDVGCGNGVITNMLNENFNVTGIDISKDALSFIKGQKIRTSSAKIPIHDLSFDLVFSSELLEHLSTKLLLRTINEFKRIAKKYIIITTPNEEFLPKRYIKCSNCQFIFHVDHHLQSFTAENIKSLIENGFELIDINYFGWLDRDYNKFLLRIKQNIGNTWWIHGREHTICPKCENKNFPIENGNIVSKICNAINRLISNKKKKPYWMFLLFKKRH